jgi:hypothetical protein
LELRRKVHAAPDALQQAKCARRPFWSEYARSVSDALNDRID